MCVSASRAPPCSRVSAIGQLIETLLGRLAVCEGTFGDATPFSDMTVDAIGDALETHGCDRHGNETMYDALSGMEFESKVFVGPTFYQRLKHMAADKIHQRARGPRQVLTHQPLEGRARDGGLRMGECVSKFQRPLSFQQRTLRTHTRSMTPATGVHGTDASGSLSHVHIRTPTVCRMERDCLISHGVHHVLQERLMLVSDPFDAHICSTCGHFAHAPVKNALISGREATCSLCNSSRNISVVTIPFACKLLLQELQGMHIGVRLVT
jgi:DNA-directed RNA polymerase II subunit RPB2